MEQIVIGFSRPKHWKIFAQAIMKAYGTPYSHVYIKLYSKKYNRHLIYQASKSMVNFMSVDVFCDENEIFAEIPLNIQAADYIELMQFCIDNAGKPYSVREAFGFAIQKIASWFGRKIDNPIKMDKREWVCSIVGAFVVKQFAKIELGQNYQDIDPQELYEYLIKITQQ